MRALAFVLLAACATNVTRVKELHVPEGSTDTRDKPIHARERRTVTLGAVRVDDEFPGGAFTAVRDDNGVIEITIAPENEPVNDSAWFAFRVAGEPSELTIRLRYEGGTHRYQPKTSRDGVTWTSLSADATEDKKVATFRLAVTKEPVFVAAQEIVTEVALPCAKKETIGTSVGGRPIELFRVGSGRERIVILGRQHPPEVTGTLALQTFVETICANAAFLARYEVIVVPLVNPDGVFDGHWRHNLHGIDLNRDWAHFRQPETRAIKEALAALDGIVFAIDFHSTFKDVFYVLPEPTALVTDWIAAIAQRLPAYQYRVQPVTLDVPAGTIWLHKMFGIPTVAYEVGDDTPRETLREIARTAADELMRLLLTRPAR